MSAYGDRISVIINHFSEKENKKLKTDVFLRLCEKVGEEDQEINDLIHNTYSFLDELRNDDSIKWKNYIKSFNELKKLVRTKHGYTSRGLISEEYTGIGMAIGVAIGTSFVGVNPAFIGVGLPIGLAIGAAIGTKKEKEAEEAGKTY